ncbi:hypothetical protein CDL12_19062 [Handroanthus impetiginosus]|uniref:Uncharacterized protein n=1 Tax=Handroanthus impetiginosus TaxID=429701 RepID=A0A2G9GKC1_9LAMI|nr:hypothetical protein CDL12_21715 [Handroanthus impetiginosus]PIN08361.1 hypothetical protein CDL12_19062 [Handroanthus impetiginosus]
MECPSLLSIIFSISYTLIYLYFSRNKVLCPTQHTRAAADFPANRFRSSTTSSSPQATRPCEFCLFFSFLCEVFCSSILWGYSLITVSSSTLCPPTEQENQDSISNIFQVYRLSSCF